VNAAVASRSIRALDGSLAAGSAAASRGHEKYHGSYRTMANQLGKRYMCEKCGTEVLCNKPGTGAIECCDAEMKIKEAKALPSSD
jgi:hypothetical protein